MIPNEAKNQFQEIITNEMFEMDRALGGVMAATQSNASSRGAGTSGPAMQALTQDATNSLKARAQFILGQLLRCLAVHHVVMTPDTLAEASTLLRDAIQTQAQLVRGRLFGNGVFSIQSLAAARQQLQAQYDQEGPRLVGRLTTELKLVAAACGLGPKRATDGTVELRRTHPRKDVWRSPGPQIRPQHGLSPSLLSLPFPFQEGGLTTRSPRRR